VIAVDGRTKWSGFEVFELAPGPHTIIVDYFYETGGTQAFGNSVVYSPIQKHSCGQKNVTLNVEAGHEYTLKQKGFRKIVHRHVIIIDVSTGATVADVE
jgi:hypothetical protein